MIAQLLIKAVSVNRAALEQLIEAWAWAQLRATGGAGVRSYAAQQRLVVYQDAATLAAVAEQGGAVGGKPSRRVDVNIEGWIDVTVTSPPCTEGEEAAEARGVHTLRRADGSTISLSLHPWNHGPLDLPAARFDAVRKKHASMLSVQHATLVDAMSGRRLDVLEQCVPIEIVNPQGRDGTEIGATPHAPTAHAPTAHAAMRPRDTMDRTYFFFPLPPPSPALAAPLPPSPPFPPAPPPPDPSASMPPPPEASVFAAAAAAAAAARIMVAFESWTETLLLLLRSRAKRRD